MNPIQELRARLMTLAMPALAEMVSREPWNAQKHANSMNEAINALMLPLTEPAPELPKEPAA